MVRTFKFSVAVRVTETVVIANLTTPVIIVPLGNFVCQVCDRGVCLNGTNLAWMSIHRDKVVCNACSEGHDTPVMWRRNDVGPGVSNLPMDGYNGVTEAFMQQIENAHHLTYPDHVMDFSDFDEERQRWIDQKRLILKLVKRRRLEVAMMNWRRVLLMVRLVQKEHDRVIPHIAQRTIMRAVNSTWCDVVVPGSP